MESVEDQEEVAVTLLRQFLAIDTSHPSPHYQVYPIALDTLTKNLKNFQESTRWLEQQAQRLGLDCRVQEVVEGKPTVLITR